MCASVLSLGWDVVAEAECKLISFDINIFPLSSDQLRIEIGVHAWPNFGSISLYLRNINKT
jgi:hypothetical protein